ncbi:MAG: hypothetical protein AB1430_10200 [Pseudomonadota bacterium]
MEAIVPAGFEPFVKLTQSNFALLTEFWLTPAVMYAPMAGAQRAFGSAQDGAAGSSAAEAFSRLMRGVMENYSRFLVELTQSGITAWNRTPAVAEAAR